MKSKRILLVHGMWLGDHTWWRTWKKALETAGYKVLIETLPEHTEGGRPDHLSVNDYVAEVRRTVQKIGPCTIIGHSMGGVIVQKVAQLEENVEQVVIVASAAPKGIRAVDSRIAWIMAMNPIDYLWRMWTGRAFHIKGVHARRLMMNRHPAYAAPSSTELFPSMESGRAVWELAFGKISVDPITRCPSLVVGGRWDRMTPLRIQRAIALLHESPLIEFDGGHMPMIEACSEGVIAQIIQWMERT